MDKLQSILDKLKTRIIDGVAFVTSTSVAEAFEVGHDRMLRSIRGVLNDTTPLNLDSRGEIPAPLNLISREEITLIPKPTSNEDIVGSLI